jgi:hypothetical protein
MPRVAFSYEEGIHHVYALSLPSPAVPAASWMLFCPECAQKMRIIMAAPAQDGRETRTYECAYGHRESMTVALP